MKYKNRCHEHCKKSFKEENAAVSIMGDNPAKGEPIIPEVRKAINKASGFNKISTKTTEGS